MRKSYNGAKVLSRTDSPCVDLFSIIGSARRHPAQIIQVFERAFASQPQLALRILLWARDARDGAGERTVFRNILHWLERRHPAVAESLVQAGAIQRFGRWDDMLHLQSRAVWPAVAEQVYVALAHDDRLAAKWMPRQGPIALKLRRGINATEADWRRGLVKLSDTVEQKMCAGDWGSIDFSKVPSVAAARNQNAFREHAGEQYTTYLESVTKGEATMHAAAVFPHDIVKAASHNDEAATVQWSQLPKPNLAGGALVLCDVSSSMEVKVSGTTSALDVCVALGLLLSENLPEPFRNQVVTFCTKPGWHHIEGHTLHARAQSLRGAEWGGSTDIQAAFELILSRAVAARADGISVDLPATFVVLSDMEFNIACHNRTPNHDQIERKFRAAGFNMPTLVYWNLNGRANNIPAGNTPGVVLISGYSPRIADVALSGDFTNFTPEQVMLEAVGHPRYDLPGITC